MQDDCRSRRQYYRRFQNGHNEQNLQQCQLHPQEHFSHSPPLHSAIHHRFLGSYCTGRDSLHRSCNWKYASILSVRGRSSHSMWQQLLQRSDEVSEVILPASLVLRGGSFFILQIII